MRQFKWSLVSRTMFDWARMQVPIALTDIQRAARFFYLQQLCFGAKATGRTFGTSTTAPPKLNLLRIEEQLSEAHMRLARVTIENLDWKDCIRRYDRNHLACGMGQHEIDSSKGAATPSFLLAST
ncbi:hypothetical protein HAQ06_18380 [Pseudomonas sp. C2L12B]|nr:hypothetical protein [Pseudomonas typographi]